MKKIGALIVFVFVMVTFTAAQADVRAGDFSIGASIGGYFFEGNQDYKNNITWGVHAGYNFTDNIALEIFVNTVSSEFEDRGGDQTSRVYVGGIEGIYNFIPNSRFVPFLAIGIGAIHYTSDDSALVPSKYTVDYGAGFKYFMTENLALRTDVRHVLPLCEKSEYGDNPHFVHNDLLATIGISYEFGGAKEKQVVKVEKPANKEMIGDADKDGVPDNVDKCPDTPRGVAVDKDGCPIDSDKDGVPDYLDKCPNTPAGETVEEDGCVHTNYSIALKVEFDTGKSVIKKKYHEEIRTAAIFMKKHPEATATIVGHTDNVGNPDKNMALSEERAKSVRQYLIDVFGIRYRWFPHHGSW